MVTYVLLSASTIDINYYADKSVSYIVATDAGGGYDAYARLIGGYLEEKLNEALEDLQTLEH